MKCWAVLYSRKSRQGMFACKPVRQPVSWALPAGKGSPLIRWANMVFQAVFCKYVLRPHPHSVPISDACVMREPFRALVNRGSFRMLIELPNLNNLGYCKCNYSYQLGLEFWVFGEVIPNKLSLLTYLDFTYWLLYRSQRQSQQFTVRSWVASQSEVSLPSICITFCWSTCKLLWLLHCAVCMCAVVLQPHSQAYPVFALQFLVTIIHGSGRTAKMWKALEHQVSDIGWT